MSKPKPTFKETLSRAQRIARAYASHDAKPWTAEIKIVDMQVHVGTLAQAVLEQGGFKPATDIREQVGSELATILFILFDLAEECKIDLEQTFEALLAQTERELKKG